MKRQEAAPGAARVARRKQAQGATAAFERIPKGKYGELLA
jgi:hypothetical protein